MLGARVAKAETARGPARTVKAPKLLLAWLTVTICCVAPAGQAFATPLVSVHAMAQEASANWAGYVVTSGKPFRRVVGAWGQPRVSCEGMRDSYSAFWVGLGGFTRNAHGLEQIGTEADCAQGVSSSYAWYELLPAAPVRLKLTVHPGDELAASVTVDGHDVTLHLHDLSTGKSLAKTVRLTSPDTSSADWIAEAPSTCVSGGQLCHVLPLTDFSSVTFAGATAATRAGAMSPIDSPAFHPTKVTLKSSRIGFGIPGRAIEGAPGGQATPSLLAESGSSFTITWEPAATSQPAPPPFAARARAAADHSGRANA